MSAEMVSPGPRLELLPGNLHWRLRGRPYSLNNLVATIIARNRGDIDVSSLRVALRPQSHCSILGKNEWYTPSIARGDHLALGEIRLSTLEDQCIVGAECTYRSGDLRREVHSLTIPGSHDVAQEASLLFVSYRSSDVGRLGDLLRCLQSLPVRVWIAHCDLDVQAGDWFPFVITQTLERAQIFVPILSKNALESRWVLEEIRLARNLLASGSLRAIVPVAIDGAVAPPELQLNSPVRYEPDRATGWAAVESSVRAALMSGDSGAEVSS